MEDNSNQNLGGLNKQAVPSGIESNPNQNPTGDFYNLAKEENLSEVFLSLAEASKRTGYHRDYLGQVARSGRLESKKIGRNWVTTQRALDKFLGREREAVAPVVESQPDPVVVMQNTEPTPVMSAIEVAVPAMELQPEVEIEQVPVLAAAIEEMPIEIETPKILVPEPVRVTSNYREEKIPQHTASVTWMEIHKDAGPNVQKALGRRVHPLRRAAPQSVRRTIPAASPQKLSSIPTRNFSTSMWVTAGITAALVLAVSGLTMMLNSRNLHVADMLPEVASDKEIAGESTTAIYLWPPPHEGIASPGANSEPRTDQVESIRNNHLRETP